MYMYSCISMTYYWICDYFSQLQQLLRHTDKDHPDHYYIEDSLCKLKQFVDTLNDSIQYSMEAVAQATPPKPKR